MISVCIVHVPGAFLSAIYGIKDILEYANDSFGAQFDVSVMNPDLEYKNESVSGVNINEEVSDVMRFSQAFQANARVLQTISDMLDTLINRTGV